MPIKSTKMDRQKGRAVAQPQLIGGYMEFKITISRIRGIGFILWYPNHYYALWLEWADGGQATPDGKLKTLWQLPRIRYVHN